ncbi:hypothetical protein C0Q70_04735 [Pomacea canaliculata]|uniref:SOCS box domain-containing protein n=1 Tax=Pomacea canaliculata TaxID=400727 RepID=A0A2T7PJ86_POMCA|nr:hypothetical protein C0Q70_04735 [Pomacea canaliculata]
MPSPTQAAFEVEDVQALKILIESGASNNRELFELSAHLEEKFVNNKTRAKTEMLDILKQAASQPRSLESLCRLTVSHALGCGTRREEKVTCLSVPQRLQQYILFHDILSEELQTPEEISHHNLCRRERKMFGQRSREHICRHGRMSRMQSLQASFTGRGVFPHDLVSSPGISTCVTNSARDCVNCFTVRNEQSALARGDMDWQVDTRRDTETSSDTHLDICGHSLRNLVVTRLDCYHNHRTLIGLARDVLSWPRDLFSNIQDSARSCQQPQHGEQKMERCSLVLASDDDASDPVYDLLRRSQDIWTGLFSNNSGKAPITWEENCSQQPGSLTVWGPQEPDALGTDFCVRYKLHPSDFTPGNAIVRKMSFASLMQACMNYSSTVSGEECIAAVFDSVLTKCTGYVGDTLMSTQTALLNVSVVQTATTMLKECFQAGNPCSSVKTPFVPVVPNSSCVQTSTATSTRTRSDETTTQRTTASTQTPRSETTTQTTTASTPTPRSQTTTQATTTSTQTPRSQTTTQTTTASTPTPRSQTTTQATTTSTQTPRSQTTTQTTRVQGSTEHQTYTTWSSRENYTLEVNRTSATQALSSPGLQFSDFPTMPSSRTPTTDGTAATSQSNEVIVESTSSFSTKSQTTIVLVSHNVGPC